MSFFPIPSHWRIPQSAMQLSLQEMALDGASGCEGVALWLGRHAGDVASITHVVALRGSGVRKAPDLLQISADLINDVTDLAIEHRATLVGHIHSHGRLFGTNLSRTDKQMGIAVPGFLSVVAPDYAMRPATAISDCGVHLFEPPSGWRRLAQAEVTARIVMTAADDAALLVAGG
jgi:hypothetical protein